jgi:AcrR family transcriptional regulator
MDVREKIIDAATRLYREVGFRGTTTRRIATEAGVNEVTVFRHFGSKETLLREAVCRGWSAVCYPLLPASPGDPRVELQAWAAEYIAGMRQAASFIRVRMAEFEEHREMIPPGGSPPARATAMLAEYVERLKEAGTARADLNAQTAASMLVGSLFADALIRDGMPDMYRNQPEESVAEYVRLFLRAIGVDQ